MNDDSMPLEMWLECIALAANGTSLGTMWTPRFGVTDDLELLTMELFDNTREEETA